MAEIVGIKAETVTAKGNIIVSHGYDQETNPYGHVGISDHYFVGREQIIKSIQSSIQVDKKHVIVLYGFGGMGKSAIVKKWAEEYSMKYNFILRLNASNEDNLKDGFGSLAQSLGLHIGSERISKEDIARVYKALGKGRHWPTGVLIFDDVRAVKTETGKEWQIYLPPKENALAERVCIIITSRAGGKTWEGLCKKESISYICVQGLSEAESYRCFLKYLQLNEWAEDDLKLKIRPLLERHHGYPLSLSCLGKSIAAHMDEGTPPSDASDYMNCVLEDLHGMLTDDTLEKLSTETLYSDSFKIIYNATLEAIQFLNRGDEAIQFLQLLACLQPDSVHVGLIRAIYLKLCFSPQPGDTAGECLTWTSLDRPSRMSLNALERYCLATKETFTLTSPAGEYNVDKIRLEKVVHSFINFHRRSNPAEREGVKKLIEASEFFVRNPPFREFLPHIKFLVENLMGLDISHETARCAAILYWRQLEVHVMWNPSEPDRGYCLDLLTKVGLLGAHVLVEDQVLIQLANLTADSLEICLNPSQQEYSQHVFQQQIQMLTTQPLSPDWIPRFCLHLLAIAAPQKEVKMEL